VTRWPENLLRRIRFCPPGPLPTGCIEYTGVAERTGYGRITRDGQRTGAHRASYELVRGPIPLGLTLDHLCRNRICVHPGHLEPVTIRENVLRGKTLPARNAAKTHCDHGHPFDDGNTYITPMGKRQCRACNLDARRRYVARGAVR
jgi:hypothetical protein